jgi:hypothetical protein
MDTGGDVCEVSPNAEASDADRRTVLDVMGLGSVDGGITTADKAADNEATGANELDAMVEVAGGVCIDKEGKSGVLLIGVENPNVVEIRAGVPGSESCSVACPFVSWYDDDESPFT